MEKLNNLKPLFSRIEELNISKEVKENVLASEGKSFADQTHHYACHDLSLAPRVRKGKPMVTLSQVVS